LTSQVTADFKLGWQIVGPSDQPSLQDFNGAMYTHGQLLAYLHQAGVPEYQAAQEFFIDSVTQYAGIIYISLTAGNIGNQPNVSPSNWVNPLALKANLASPTFTGTVGGITKAMVGLGNVDNTADSAKPVSTAQQTALNLKANLVNPTFTGTVTGTSFEIGSVSGTAGDAFVDFHSGAIPTDYDVRIISPLGTGTGALGGGRLVIVAGSLQLPVNTTGATQLPGTNNTQLATTAFVGAAVAANPSIGVGQTWQNLTASRAVEVTYTNSTGTPIFVIINFSDMDGTATIILNGLSLGTIDGGFAGAQQISFIVPDGNTYSATQTANLRTWMELR